MSDPDLNFRPSTIMAAESARFTDTFASATGALSMRDVLSRRCAEQTVEIAALRKECERLRSRLAEAIDLLPAEPHLSREVLRGVGERR